MKKFIGKILFIGLLILGLYTNIYAQNNAIFNGGNGDGNSRLAKIQSADLINRGGNGDGNSKKSIIQSSDLVYIGGNGDGNTIGKKVQNSDLFFAGGLGDGQNLSKRIQKSDEIFVGNIQDGANLSFYIQESDPVFIGGIGDGNSVNKIVQESDPIFKGGFGDGFATTYLPQAPLPLTLLKFTASKYNKVDVILNWNTAAEINTQSFTIERSTDAVYFSEIGSVNSMNKNQVYTYSFIDTEPKNGINYYRLKMIDRNGSFKYSPARAVVFDKRELDNIKIYPNPSNGLIAIEHQFEDKAGNMVITITAMNGVVVEQLILPINAEIEKIDLQNLSAGTYYIQVISDSINHSRKMIIVK